MSVFILENLYKSFVVEKREHVVLKNINLTLPDSGLVSIVGKSGSGKSTLLNILMGIEKPTKGKVYFFKKDIAKFNDKKFSKYHLDGVSLVFQHYNLFNDLTAFDNVILPLKMRGEKFFKSREKVQQLFEKFRIENLSNRKVKNLSGGEKQRVAILRSLVTNPKVILCDEPTGALDFKNSQEIMQILREISEKTLVVMVSHNKTLVNQFSDQILTLKDGEIVSNISNIKDKFTSNYEKRKYVYNSAWASKFLRLNLLKNFKKNIFSIISCSVAFASMFISVGFSIGSKNSQDEALLRNLSVGYATVSNSQFVEIEGSPLSFQKTTRPDLIDVDNYFRDFSSIRCEENISYLISNYPSCVFNGETITNFSMVPVYDMKLLNYGKNLLKKGTAGTNSFNEIFINNEFAKIIGNDVLNKEVVIRNSTAINFPTGDDKTPFIKDTLIVEEKFKIVGILDEFSFLNSPKVYFSYKGAKSYLKSKMMENLSFYKGENYSYFDYILDCKNDDPISSYSSYIFLDDLSEIDKFYELIANTSESGIQVTSSALEIKQTYSTFIESFSTTLILFVIIAFAGINFILGMISLSTFIENKKTTAIMTCLGSKNSTIYNLYLIENFIAIIFSFIISIISAYFLQGFLNKILFSKFSLNNLIAIPFANFYGIKYGLILFLLGIAIIFSTIFTLTPMMIYRHKSLTDELRDE